MITEDQIAAATMAQLFGSELLRVDQTTLERPGSMNSATQLDPKRFLLNNHSNNIAQNAREAQLLESLYREAELSYPLPQQPATTPVQQNVQQPIQQPISQHVSQPVQSTPVAAQVIPQPEALKQGGVVVHNLADILTKMNNNLERIANTLEGVEIKKKKSTLIKRS